MPVADKRCSCPAPDSYLALVTCSLEAQNFSVGYADRTVVPPRGPPLRDNLCPRAEDFPPMHCARQLPRYTSAWGKDMLGALVVCSLELYQDSPCLGLHVLLIVSSLIRTSSVVRQPHLVDKTVNLRRVAPTALEWTEPQT